MTSSRPCVFSTRAAAAPSLIEAFDQLHAAYQTAVDRLEELRGQRSLFDPDRSILTENLFGVDLNEEPIEICRLSVWIKTAKHGRPLTSLDRNFRVGNSLVSDPAVDPRALDWQKAFPQVFTAGGFDAVVGNPPYVRHELLAPLKPYPLPRPTAPTTAWPISTCTSTSSACACSGPGAGSPSSSPTSG